MVDHPDLLREHFFTDVAVDEHKFTALHGAFFSEGTLLYVPKNVEVELPFEVLHTVAPGGSIFPHTTIVVDENASATFVDTFKSEDADAPSISASVVEVEAKRGATVNYISLQEWGRNVHHFQTQRFTGHRDSTVRSLAVNLGSTFARTQVETVLQRRGFVLRDARPLLRRLGPALRAADAAVTQRRRTRRPTFSTRAPSRSDRGPSTPV